MLNRFNSNARKLNRVIPTKVNAETLAANLNTGSLENIQAPTTKFNSNIKSNPYPIKTINNKNSCQDETTEYIEKIKNTETKIINYEQINSLKRYVNKKISELTHELNMNIIRNKLKIK